ncbi:hypothetical protein UlMin_025078 [Ulmus minor]
MVHPLVLLSVVDHYNRVDKDTRQRVIGVLPLKDEKDPSIWFLDHNYHESMFSMFKRTNAKEHVVGWYSTGTILQENDLDIHGLFNDYVPKSCLGIPTQAYCAVAEVKENTNQKSQKVFIHVLSEIAAHKVEEIGVEHLLRDVKDTTISSLVTEIDGKLKALKSMDQEIRSYLDLATDGKLPLNHEILYYLLVHDMMLVIHLASLIRSVIAPHNLINNKVLNKKYKKNLLKMEFTYHTE